MKALTIWQPWATLIVAGAKPFEFRGWCAPKWLIDEDLGVHAGARPIDVEEVEDLIERLDDPREAWTTGLHRDLAMPILERALQQARAGRRKKPRKPAPMDLFGDAPAAPEIVAPREFEPLPLSAMLGVARVGEPVNANDTAKTFGHVLNDSDRIAHANWAWPMLDVRPFAEPLPMRGAQGIWDCPDAETAAEAWQ